MIDNRFINGADGRFLKSGVDWRFPGAGVDRRFPGGGVDARFQTSVPWGASLPLTRLFDGLYHRPELLWSSLAPLTYLSNISTSKVALAIDTSQGADVVEVKGAELAPNGDFSNGTTGYTFNSPVSFSVNGSGQAVIDRNGGGVGSFPSVTALTSGKFYFVQVEVISATHSVSIYVGDESMQLNVPSGAAAGIYSGYFYATGEDLFFGPTGVSNAECVIDNISVREIARTFTGLGAELITNGGFDTDTGWTKDAATTISGGTLSTTKTNAGEIAGQSTVTVISGKFYIVKYTVLSTNGNVIVPRLSSDNNSSGFATTTAGTFTDIIKAVQSRDGFAFNVGGSGVTAVIDNVSIKEVPGIHGIQTTANDQPSYDWTNFTLDLPGATEHLEYPNAALGDDVTAMLLVKISTDEADFIVLGSANSEYGLVARNNNNTTALSSGAGSPTYTVNGADPAWADREAAKEGLATGEWLILGIKGLDLTSSNWRGLNLTGWGNSSTYEVEGLIKASVLMQAPSLADRNQAGNYLASLISGLEYADET
jgi:hypothetical protein